MAERTPRDLETRAKAERPKAWMPPQTLPDPNPEPGYAFRWIRISTLGNSDPSNVSAKLREGWEPVKASDHPEVHVMGTGPARIIETLPIEIAHPRNEDTYSEPAFKAAERRLRSLLIESHRGPA